MRLKLKNPQEAVYARVVWVNWSEDVGENLVHLRLLDQLGLSVGELTVCESGLECLFLPTREEDVV